jgi:hypothetical protein
MVSDIPESELADCTAEQIAARKNNVSIGGYRKRKTIRRKKERKSTRKSKIRK